MVWKPLRLACTVASRARTLSGAQIIGAVLVLSGIVMIETKPLHA
jgi:hypothetical protein